MVSKGKIIAGGYASHDPYPFINHNWLSIHALYWLFDGSVHRVYDFSSNDIPWHALDTIYFDPAYGRLTIWCVNVNFANYFTNGGTYQDWDGGSKFQYFIKTNDDWKTLDADFNHDGIVDTKDVSYFLNIWNEQK